MRHTQQEMGGAWLGDGPGEGGRGRLGNESPKSVGSPSQSQTHVHSACIQIHPITSLVPPIQTISDYLVFWSVRVAEITCFLYFAGTQSPRGAANVSAVFGPHQNTSSAAVSPRGQRATHEPVFDDNDYGYGQITSLDRLSLKKGLLFASEQWKCQGVSVSVPVTPRLPCIAPVLISVSECYAGSYGGHFMGYGSGFENKSGMNKNMDFSHSKCATVFKMPLIACAYI